MCRMVNHHRVESFFCLFIRGGGPGGGGYIE